MASCNGCHASQEHQDRGNKLEAQKLVQTRSCGYFFVCSQPESTATPGNHKMNRQRRAASGVGYISCHGKGFRHRQTHGTHRLDRAGPLASPATRHRPRHQSDRCHRGRTCSCGGDRLPLLRRRTLIRTPQTTKPAASRTAGFFHRHRRERTSPPSPYWSREPLGSRFASHSCTSARMLRPSSRKFSKRLGT